MGITFGTPSPKANEYGIYSCSKTHGNKGGKTHTHYDKSQDQFDKSTLLWVSEAESPVEKNTRPEVYKVFSEVLRGINEANNESFVSQGEVIEIKNNPDYPSPASRYKLVDINLKGKSLSSFPTGFPDYEKHDFRIDNLDLSDNYLQKIPEGIHCTTLDMSGNPLNESLDAIPITAQFIKLKNCGICGLTPDFFSMLENMAYNTIGHDSEKGLRKDTIYILDVTGNPFNEETIKRIKDYGSKGNIYPNFIYDEKGFYGLQSVDLANDKKNEYEWQVSLKKIESKVKESCVASSPVNASGNMTEDEWFLGGASFRRELEQLSSLSGLASYFGILNIELLSESQQGALTRFLKEHIELPKADTEFKKYLGDYFNSILKYKSLAGYIFQGANADKKLTFNLINERMLAWQVKSGIFDGASDRLKSSLRNLFLNLQIEKEMSGSASDFARWESFFKNELKMDMQQKCQPSLSPSEETKLNRMKYKIINSEMHFFTNWLNNHPVWEAFLARQKQ